MEQLVQLLQDGGVGYMPKRKGSGWVRLMFENWNSLGLFSHGWKIDRLNQLVRDLQIDIVAGCESQCHWSLVPLKRQLLQLLCPGASTSGVAANNVNEMINRDQMGGTAISSIGRLSDVVTEVGSDVTGLGRWSWIKVGSDDKSTRVISGYLLCKPGRSARGHTVCEQHSRYFQARGEFRCPSTLFIADLANRIAAWRRAGEEVILCIDANQDVYSGKLAVRLAKSDIRLECLMERTLGERVPISHSCGTGKISTIFGSPGLEGGHAMCYPHWFGVGDHRVFVLEVSASSLFGGDYPTIARPKSRALTCKITRIRRRYCNKLTDLVSRHNMAGKLTAIQSVTGDLPAATVHQIHNKWDKEMGELMRHSEKVCTKFKSCALEFSPTIGQWLRRRAVLRWLLRWHEGKVPDTRNLVRAASRANISDPLSLSKSDVHQRLQACLEHLFDLKSEAPTLRQKHLQWRLDVAKNQGDEEASTEVLRIIRREAARQRQRNINRVVKDSRGRSVLSVGISSDSGTQTLTERSEVEEVCGEHLGERFSLGKRAPLSAASLHAVIGDLGDTEAVRHILDNDYTFSDDWDTVTVDLLRSCARLRLECDDHSNTDSDVTPEDFIGFWARSKEATSSSKSGRHFGHYRAITEDEQLVELQVQSINLAAQRGRPLDRWREGVTVLLEKVAGNNRIDKLRAICLLEADFNWWLKVHFARRMTARMRTTGVLPIEQGATSGKTALDSSISKQLFFDQANVLHYMVSVSSTDAANCFDAVNHAAGSFALQAMNIPLTIIKCYLLCIQTMRFFLKTGFGLAKHSYGGTTQNPYMGLVQGSGAASAAWIAISTVMLDAYKSKGHGAYFLSAWSGICLGIAALLYVDDTDLLHMNTGHLSERQFFHHIQRGTTYWAYLLQATGGNLKPEKCYWYLMSYKFVKGTAVLKPLKDLEQYKLSIPQQGSAAVTIKLRDPHVASEVLGVWSCPSGLGTAQLDHMLNKGRRWGQRVLHSSLRPSEVWHSFRTQALPSVRYGLIALMNSPAIVDDAFGTWYYSILPALGVNRNIARDWRTLPTQFQGLGLPLMSLEKLAVSLQYLQRHWGKDTSMGRILRCVYELTQIEVGLVGNFLCRDFSVFGVLASHTWFKVLWEYVCLYKVSVDLGNVDIPPVRQRDKVVMEEVIKIIPPAQWASFNRARKYYKVYFMSQLMLCDGITVDPAKLGNSKWPSPDSNMKFPTEQPMRADLIIWRETIAILTSSTFRLSPRLGKHVRLPYDTVHWLTDQTNSVLVQVTGEGQQTIYLPLSTRYSTRGRQVYRLSKEQRDTAGCVYVASVQHSSQAMASVHSQSLVIPSSTPLKALNLKQALSRLPQCHFLHGLKITGDGAWLFEAFDRGSLIACHDGSFMPDEDESRCSAAVVLLCKDTGQLATITYCELTAPGIASNYRGELIGSIATTAAFIALKTSTTTYTPRTCNIFCDNMGVVLHANARFKPLPEKQAQADLLYLLRHNLDRLEKAVKYIHVYGHLDDDLRFDQLTLPQQLNVMADKLAKECLLDGIRKSTSHSPTYTDEPMRIWIHGQKVTSSIRTALYNAWGSQTAQRLLGRKDIVSHLRFHHIAWDAVGRAMTSYPQMFALWVTKHVSGFSGTNRQLSRIDTTIANKCPCCRQNNESTGHITRCTNPGRTCVFEKSFDALMDWMEESHCDRSLIDCLEEYLLRRGKRTMTSISATFPHLSKWAIEMDELGWDNFLEGRVGSTLFHMQKLELKRSGSRRHIHSWSTEFIHHVLGITHKQWIFRNTRTHICLLEGRTVAEHITIMEQVSQLLFTDPQNLLPQHRYLLDLDFSELGAGSTTNRQYWLASLTYALEARRHFDVAQGRISTRTFTSTSQELTHSR